MNTRAFVSLVAFILTLITARAADSQPGTPQSFTNRSTVEQRKPTADTYRVWIKVVDENGQPIVGAVATKDGVRTGGSTSWGGTDGFDSQAVSGTNGEFYFERKRSFTALQMSIKALGFAVNKCWVNASNDLQTITLDAGATVRGRVTKDGQPLTNVVVGISGVDRNAASFMGSYTATTDVNGFYEFLHLPARKSWWLYGTMNSLKQIGTTQPRQILTAAPGETNNLDDLEVTRGLRLAGQVQARWGLPLPDGTLLYVGYQHGDGQNLKVDQSGKFEFTGLIPGRIEVNLRQPKWHLSSVNRSLDTWNSYELTGLLQQDKDDLLLVIEPGERLYSYNNSNGQLPLVDNSSGRPLFGAEASGPVPIVLAGQVLDDATGKPLRAFKVVPGRKPPVNTRMGTPSKPLLQQLTGAFRKPITPWSELPWWDFARTDVFSNGVFSVDFLPLTSTPMFRIEADGYDSFVSEPMGTNTTNLVIRLKTGTGPSGVVLLPDGMPAVGAKVWYAVAREQSTLSERNLNSYGDRAALKTTDTNGQFSFMPRPEGRTLFITHSNGWAEQEVKSDTSRLKIQLGAWATVVGTLVSSNGTPMPGVTLHLNLSHDWSAGDPILNTQEKAITDSKGKFTFTDVPPGRLNLDREVPVGASGWRYQPQTWFVCQPGITNDLGNVTYDSPPPQPFGEKVKKVLGL